MRLSISNFQALRFLMLAACLVGPAMAAGSGDWPTYGHDYGDSRHSPLNQINAGNVASLKPVWTFHMRPPDVTRGFASSEDTPIVIGDVMYVSTPYGRVIALDAATGMERWAYQVPHGDQPATRGVSYWPGPRPEIVFGTRGGLLIALNAATGSPVKGFGQDGVVDLHSDAVMQGLPEGAARHHVRAGDLQKSRHNWLASAGNSSTGRLWPGTSFRCAHWPGSLAFQWGSLARGAISRQLGGRQLGEAFRCVNVWAGLTLDA